MLTTTVYFVRHCEYANPQNVIPFRLPGFPLSTKGKKDAQKLAQFFADKSINIIFTSPLLRTRQTANIIGEKLKTKPTSSDLILETRTPLQGMPKDQFDAEGGNALTHPKHIKEGGETKEEIFSRVNKFIQQVLLTHPGKNIIIVSHGDPIKIFTKTPLLPMGGIIRLKFTVKHLDSTQQIRSIV